MKVYGAVLTPTRSVFRGIILKLKDLRWLKKGVLCIWDFIFEQLLRVGTAKIKALRFRNP